MLLFLQIVCNIIFLGALPDPTKTARGTTWRRYAKYPIHTRRKMYPSLGFTSSHLYFIFSRIIESSNRPSQTKPRRCEQAWESAWSLPGTRRGRPRAVRKPRGKCRWLLAPSAKQSRALAVGKPRGELRWPMPIESY